MNNSDHKSLALQALEQVHKSTALFALAYLADRIPQRGNKRRHAHIQAAMEWVRRQED